MKAGRFAIFIAAGFVLTFMLLSVSTARAEDFFFRFAPPLGSVDCNTNGGDPRADITAYTVEFNLPAGASTDNYVIANDDALFQSNSPRSSGTGSQAYSAYFVPGVPFPFRAGARYDTLIDGKVIYHSSLIIECSGIGVGSVSIVNEAVGVDGGSAIRDGRINPENYAPVALYCDGSVLTAYKIDSTGGTFAWKFNVSGPSDQPLPNSLGISLLRAPDIRLSVLAPEPDGKQYLFVFDGCPYPGVIEVYISDPATGQFVPTE